MFKPRANLKLATNRAIPRSADHQRLVALINSLTDGFLAISASGKIVLTNGAALGLLDSNALVGKNFKDSLKLIDRKNNPVDPSALLQSKASFSTRDLRLSYGNGTALNIEVNISPVRVGFGFNQSGGFVILLRDVTVEKSLEEEREEFISVAGHELRTPVAIAEASVSNALLLAQNAAVNDSITDSLKAAHEQITFLGSLINDLYMLSRAERKNLNLNFKTIDIAKLLSDLKQDYSPQAQTKGLRLEVEPPEANLSLVSSELYVKEILQNFITNAIKYTAKGVVEISAANTRSEVEFQIRDSGFGITTEEHSKLFSKFFRSDDPRVQKINGSGLGLYVAAKLAKLIGARVSAETELNKGSVFKLSVPG